MTLIDAGSGLQILGGATELVALIWGARKIDLDLRQRRWSHAKGELDTEVAVIAKAFSGDPEGATSLITRFVLDQIESLFGALEDVTSKPLRLFIAGVALHIAGVVFVAGWIRS